MPMTAPTARPMLLEGYASTNDLDFQRTRVRGYAFGLLCGAPPPLLYRHDTTQPAGEIEELKYDEHGRLLIRARVDHPEARRCGGFSVGATVSIIGS